MSTLILRPVSDETNEFNLTGADSGWDCVNDVTPDDDSTYVSIEEDGNYYGSYLIDKNLIPSNITINSVKIYACIKTLTVDYGDNLVGLWFGGNNAFDSPDLGIEDNSPYTVKSYSWSDNPYTSSPWVVSDFNTFGFYLVLSFSRCTQTYLEIDYTENSGLILNYAGGTATGLKVNQV